MPSDLQIALFSQRLLRGKLHLPYFTADVRDSISASLDTIAQHPVCDRQLNNHRASRKQLHDKLEYAGSLEEFTYQLLSGRACRHSAKTSGLLVCLASRVEEEEDSLDDATD